VFELWLCKLPGRIKALVLSEGRDAIASVKARPRADWGKFLVPSLQSAQVSVSGSPFSGWYSLYGPADGSVTKYPFAIDCDANQHIPIVKGTRYRLPLVIDSPFVCFSHLLFTRDLYEGGGWGEPEQASRSVGA
jgi:hypothetical protein